MNAFLSKKRGFTPPLRRFFKTAALFSTLCLVFPVSACSKQKSTDYFSYVSECRSNILLAQTDDFSLRIYATTKEYPYAADGVPHDTTTRTELYLIAPSGDKDCRFSFTVGDETYTGDMAFDNVKAEYYYSCTLDVSQTQEIPCTFTYGETELALTAVSVLSENTYTPQKALQTLMDTEAELFTEWTDEYGFVGEIYLRLIYEDAPYYYIGLIDRNEKMIAFLMNAETGKVLAKREN